MFPCTKCGCCCMRAGSIEENLKKIFDEIPAELLFPYKTTDGRCEKLRDDMTCSVYDSRPLICNVSKIGELVGGSREKFYQDNAAACNKMQLEDGVSEKFRVIIK